MPIGAKRRRRLAWLVVILLLVVAGVGVGVYRRYWRQNLRRFQVVRPAVLYRSGQPSERGLRYLVESHGVKTDLCLRRQEHRLRQGLLFTPSEPRGSFEGDYAAGLGIRYLRWPLGDEVYWPWLTPQQLEDFFRLMDDPANLPVVVHCAEGRHRTGTYAALFRLEYGRWDVERTLAEMHSFDFGPPVAIQEHNLRTYSPRPLPDARQLAELRGHFAAALPEELPRDYERLVLGLRQSEDRSKVRQLLEAYLKQERPFALCLARRLIDRPDDPVAPVAAEHAGRCLQRPKADETDWAAAAALIADFGTREQQADLLALLEAEPKTGPPSGRYGAVAAGVTNRYTPNRIAYLRPLLDDRRHRPEAAAAKYRYADTAVARLTSILNRRFLPDDGRIDPQAWDEAAEAARRWFADHPEAATPRPHSSSGSQRVY